MADLRLKHLVSGPWFPQRSQVFDETVQRWAEFHHGDATALRWIEQSAALGTLVGLPRRVAEDPRIDAALAAGSTAAHTRVMREMTRAKTPAQALAKRLQK